jgi:branched-chain amino acid transport system permease protein
MVEAGQKSKRQLWQGQLLSFAPYVIAGVILIILPPFTSAYIQGILMKILIYGIFALSLNLLIGYTGLFSFGHAAFFGVGGYTAGILMVRCGIESFWLLAPASVLVTALVASVFGIIALRVSFMYFLLITFALGQLVFTVAWKWSSVTGGSDALTGIGRPDLGLPWFTWNDTYVYYFVLLAFLICSFLLYRIVKSPFGQALQGIRESELRMKNLGYNTWLHKYIAYILAGIFAGIAGMLYAHFNGLMSPSYAGVATSGVVILMVIIGSAETFIGPVIGAAVVVLLESIASIFVPQRWPLILGGALVITMMFLRDGITVYLIGLWRKLKGSYGSAEG